MSEAPLTEEARKRFRARYVELFGPVTGDDPLYELVSAGRQHQGMEHWLPLFHERLETLFDYLPDAVVTFDPLDDDARAKRLEQVQDHYEARQQALERKDVWRPALQPGAAGDACFSPTASGRRRYKAARGSCWIPSSTRTRRATPTVVSFGGRQGRSFAAGAAARRGQCVRRRGRPCRPASRRRQARARRLLEQRRQGAPGDPARRAWRRRHAARRDLARGAGSASNQPPPLPCCRSRPASRRRASPSSANRTSSATGWCAAPAPRRGSDVLTEVSSLTAGDLVVHADHGIGRFVGLHDHRGCRRAA